jgi:hypothetical protein
MKQAKYFRPPPRSVIEKMTDDDFQRERKGVIKRTTEIYRLFGPPRSMLFMGTMTAEAYFEMINSYIFGLYLSTIFTAHALIESAMAFNFAIGSEDEIAEGGLGKLSAASLERGYITREVYDRINELRIMRIAYFHSHVGLNKRGAMTRYLDKKLAPVDAHRKDAAEALRIVYEFIHSQ